MQGPSLLQAKRKQPSHAWSRHAMASWSRWRNTHDIAIICYLPILVPYRGARAASSADLAPAIYYSRVASTSASSTMLHSASEPEMTGLWTGISMSGSGHALYRTPSLTVPNRYVMIASVVVRPVVTCATSAKVCRL